MTNAAVNPDPSGFLRLARVNPDFARFWAGATISDFGSSITNLALPLVAVITLKAGAQQMGLLNAMQHTPDLLLALFAGVWLDRARRKPILITTELGQGLLLALVPLAAITGWLSMPLLYGVVFAVGTLAMLQVLSGTSFLPSIVARADLADGNAKLQLSRSTARVSGPGIAGLLVHVLSAPIAILFDAISFLVSSFLYTRIKFEEPARAGDVASQGVWFEIKEGIHLTFDHPVLRAMIIATTVASAGAAIQASVWALFLVRSLNMTPLWIGLVGSAGGAASIVAALAAVRLSATLSSLRLMALAALLEAVAMTLLPLARHFGELQLVLVLLSQAGTSLGLTLFSITQISLRQAITPDRLLGRINATRRVVVFGVIPPAALVGGYLGARFGFVPTLFIAAGVMLAASLYLLLSRG